MDIRKHAVSETTTLHLRDAAEELMFDGDKPVTVTVYGPGSKQYAKAQTGQSNRLIDRMKKKGKADQTAEESAKEKAEFLAACTHSMDGIEYDGLTGEALHKAVYSDISIGFIADQVAKHVGDWANFTKGSQKT
jgi:hypothetical protein